MRKTVAAGVLAAVLVLSAVAASDQPAPAIVTLAQIEPIAAAADRREFAEAVRLLDELLPGVGDPAQKAQLDVLRASLSGQAQYERWRAIDTQAGHAAQQREFARAAGLAREAAAGVNAIDLATVGDAAADLRTLRRHINERALEMALAVDTESFNTLTTDGLYYEAEALRRSLLQRIADALEPPTPADGTTDALSDSQRTRLEDRRAQLVQSRDYLWQQIFKHAAQLVIDGKRDQGRAALHRLIEECPVPAYVEKAKAGLVQMDQ